MRAEVIGKPAIQIAQPDAASYDTPPGECCVFVARG